MALTWTDLTALEKSAALASIQSQRDAAIRAEAVDEAKMALDAAQALWRTDAKGMTKTNYKKVVVARDAEIAALQAAYEAAIKGA